MVVAILSMLCALGSTAYAASQLPKNSVGSRQLKKRSVTTGKIANNAVNGAKVAKASLTGADINLSALGTVPSAGRADSAGNADTVGGHPASCPAGATLIRGICFDSSAGPVAADVRSASDACAAKGGYLPSPLELYSIRGVVNLGSGEGTDHMFTDVIYTESGGSYRTIVVDGTGNFTFLELNKPGRYVCAYPLVR
jgi:hypothetical protein